MKNSIKQYLNIIFRVVEITIVLLGLLCILYTIGVLKNIDLSNIIGSLFASMFSIIGSVVIIMIELKNNEMKEEEKLAPKLIVGHSPVFSIDKSKEINNREGISIPIINCGMSPITNIICNVGFSENLIHMLKLKDEGRFFRLKSFKEGKEIEKNFNKSISTEPITFLNVGESKTIKFSEIYVQEYLNEIWRVHDRNKIDELFSNAIILNLKISFMDYRQKEVNVATELKYEMQFIIDSTATGRITGDVMVAEN